MIATVADGTVDDALAAVDAADARGRGWAATRPARAGGDPAPGLRADDRRGPTSSRTLISLENGKALPTPRGEVAYAAEFFRWYAEEAVRASGGMVTTAPSGANRILVVQQPVGICVLVTPWNFPAAMATRKIGPGPGRRLHGGAQAGVATPR